MKILSLGEKNIREGKGVPAKEALARIKTRVREAHTEVILTPEAINDLVSIYNYIYETTNQEQAEVILNRLEKHMQTLATLAMRGMPGELTPFGNHKIREIQESPWRIFYRPEKDEVFVLSVLDGRRAMAELLLERLVR